MNSISFNLPRETMVGMGRDYVRWLADPEVAYLTAGSVCHEKTLVVHKTARFLTLGFGRDELRISLDHIFGGEIHGAELFGYPIFTLVLWFGHSRADGGYRIVTAPRSEKELFVDLQRRLDPLVPGGVTWNTQQPAGDEGDL
jgi:hypothetical protein